MRMAPLLVALLALWACGGETNTAPAKIGGAADSGAAKAATTGAMPLVRYYTISDA